MGQYGKNFYGSVYYGNTNAFSGTYETVKLFSEQPLKGTFNVNINAIVPDYYYDRHAFEVKQASGTWTDDSTYGYIESNSPSAELKFMATCDRVKINYQQNSTAPTNVNVQITTSQPGKADVVTNYTFNPNSTTINSNAYYTIDNLPYGMQQVRIFLNSTNPSTSYFRFKGVSARVTNLTIETRASTNGTTWSTYANIPFTMSANANVTNGYYITGTSPSYAGDQYLQVKLHLASSDNDTTPTIQDLETIAGDSNNRTEKGTWEAIFDMASVAAAAVVGSVVDADATANTGAVPVLSNVMGFTSNDTVTFVIGSSYTISSITGTSGATYTATKDSTVQTLFHVAGSNHTNFDLNINGCVSGDNWKFSVTTSGRTFKEVTEIDWLGTIPSTTTMVVRSSSSPDKLAFGPVSAPYRQGVHRLRLKKGFNDGYMDLPIISPGTTYTRNLRWDNWNDQSYMPVDESGVTVKYIAMDSTMNETNPLHLITNPMNIPLGNRSFLRTALKDGRDFHLRVRLTRPYGKATPVVDWINLFSWMEYKEEFHINDYDSSAVDSNNTGKKYLTKLTDYTYHPPVEVAIPDYYLIDMTGRPNDTNVYYGFEENVMQRTNVTSDKFNNGSIYVKAETRDVGEVKGLVKHYQYGGGTAKYPITDETEMAPTFTPSLNANIKYRYYLETGWPTVYHTVQSGETFDSIAIDYNVSVDELKSVNPRPTYDNNGNLVTNQNLQIPNDSVNLDVSLNWKTEEGNSSMTYLTDMSSHNAYLLGSSNLASDVIQANVSNSSVYGKVDWVSGEKIYDGIINTNDIRSTYIRKQDAPKSGDSAQISYTAVSGDTYSSIAKKFGVYELDIRNLNNARDGQEPVADQIVIVPSQIVLPEIDSQAIIGDSPYEISIVYNSAHKKDGTKLSESVIIPNAMAVEYSPVQIKREQIIRGSVANGKDYLSKPRVISIDSVEDENGVMYNETTSSGGITIYGDFILENNAVNWDQSENSLAKEPVSGTKYYVTYTYDAVSSITVSIDTTYQEQGGVDHIWRSPEVKEFSGMCSPGIDYQAQLPSFSSWVGVDDDPYVEDFEYIIEDNDLWVKTYIKQDDSGNYYAIGTLQDRIPKDNWFPTINTGYYYLADKEFYLYSEPIVLEPTDREMPVAKNVTYVSGKFDNAAQVESGSTNLVLNSGFDVATTQTTVYKLTF